MVLVLQWKHSYYLMINFNERSYRKELLDGDDIPFADIRRNMQELEFINTYLGGHAITVRGFKKLLESRKSVSVCEIGCGGGDNLEALNRWCSKKNVSVTFTGVDINPKCIAYANTRSLINNVSYITSDYRLLKFSDKPDIIFSSLFCHHFANAELPDMLKWMKENSLLGFFINDLHRHPVAYHFIRLATRIFSRSYLVKNDAPLSVLRGFKKEEWIDVLQQAGIENYSVEWKWAFRYLVSPLSPKGGT